MRNDQPEREILDVLHRMMLGGALVHKRRWSQRGVYGEYVLRGPDGFGDTNVTTLAVDRLARAQVIEAPSKPNEDMPLEEDLGLRLPESMRTRVDWYEDLPAGRVYRIARI